MTRHYAVVAIFGLACTKYVHFLTIAVVRGARGALLPEQRRSLRYHHLGYAIASAALVYSCCIHVYISTSTCISGAGGRHPTATGQNTLLLLHCYTGITGRYCIVPFSFLLLGLCFTVLLKVMFNCKTFRRTLLRAEQQPGRDSPD